MNKPFTHASAAHLSGRHLLGIEGLSVPEIQALLSRSSHFADVLTGKAKDNSLSSLLKGTSLLLICFLKIPPARAYLLRLQPNIWALRF